MNSWKTTIAGSVAIIGGVFLLANDASAQDAVIAGTLIAAGLGLIGAQDNSNSNEKPRNKEKS